MRGWGLISISTPYSCPKPRPTGYSVSGSEARLLLSPSPTPISSSGVHQGSPRQGCWGSVLMAGGLDCSGVEGAASARGWEGTQAGKLARGPTRRCSRLFLSALLPSHPALCSRGDSLQSPTAEQRWRQSPYLGWALRPPAVPVQPLLCLLQGLTLSCSLCHSCPALSNICPMGAWTEQVSPGPFEGWPQPFVSHCWCPASGWSLSSPPQDTSLGVGHLPFSQGPICVAPLRGTGGSFLP